MDRGRTVRQPRRAETIIQLTGRLPLSVFPQTQQRPEFQRLPPREVEIAFKCMANAKQHGSIFVSVLAISLFIPPS